ncbi:enoyl-CoA hydratase/isomerase family protein [Mycetocola tolaasinivorans]|uniref:Enoyl-CoA hydratase/isomerase family protein n=1 Tax=Mycetocola tolaasinivorans TaxID=76635 RepID=A0A3L6ZYB5_9MICO|nr:enoyl-CoA hydratase/isomerase family protein [Mycetocola tolaasinivorans]RLP72695.1 enoyl-CoA hydratase/isomerase family protein [Mycetocola tolaasinivorans]
MTAPHSADPVLLRVSEGIARITLNRPERLGAINRDSALAWREIAGEVTTRGDVRAIVLDSVGPAFCAGGDVLEFAALARDGGTTIAELADVIHDGHRILTSAPIPIVTAVQGAVAGGGLGFMLVGDYVVAADSARFVSRYADIGLTPDCGVSTLLPEAIGMRRALELVLSDRSLDAQTALDWGLITEVVPGEDLANRALAVARHWAGGASLAFGQAKRLLRTGVGRSFQAGLDDEAHTIGAAFAGPESAERIAAFAARSRSSAPAPAPAPATTPEGETR